MPTKNEGFPHVVTLDVVATNGVPFRVLLITGPDGAPSAFRVGSEPTVEFHDRRYASPDAESPGFTAHGQFTGSCYHLNDLLDRSEIGALSLNGGAASWYVDAETMVVVDLWLRVMRTRWMASR